MEAAAGAFPLPSGHLSSPGGITLCQPGKHCCSVWASSTASSQPGSPPSPPLPRAPSLTPLPGPVPQGHSSSFGLQGTPSFGCSHTGPGALPAIPEGSTRMFQRWAGLNTELEHSLTWSSLLLLCLNPSPCLVPVSHHTVTLGFHRSRPHPLAALAGRCPESHHKA